MRCAVLHIALQRKAFVDPLKCVLHTGTLHMDGMLPGSETATPWQGHATQTYMAVAQFLTSSTADMVDLVIDCLIKTCPDSSQIVVCKIPRKLGQQRHPPLLPPGSRELSRSSWRCIVQVHNVNIPALSRHRALCAGGRSALM